MSELPPPRLVVGVGASAGGLEAFRHLLSVLPPDAGMAFLLVQHLDPSHPSLLGALLAAHTEMQVCDADQSLQLLPNTVYVIRPDTALAVHHGRIELTTPTLHRGVRLPIDHLFRSLAKEYGSRSVGVVLSGSGSDGSAGLREIKAAGGLVIAQSVESCGQVGMPQSAIDTGAVDLVLNIADIPAALARFASLPPTAGAEVPSVEQQELIDEAEEPPPRLSDQELIRLAAVLEAQLSFDLRVYKSATIERRVLRRMALSGFDRPEPYFEYLRAHPTERQTLVRDLLISVTEFFRDPTAFTALRRQVIDPLVAESPPGKSLRAWVPGCATGEEAYSIAIEFLESIELHDKRMNVQIFATDVDQDALAFARAGIYSTAIVDFVSPQRLQRYFKLLDGKGYQVRSSLRDVISFAVHDLTKDPPFSRMHLVSCRNVLIYLNAQAQRHVLKILHFALQPEGHLLLSTSESTGPQRTLFATVSKKHRIYRKVGHSRPVTVARSRNVSSNERSGVQERSQPEAARANFSGTDLARRAVVDAFAPPTVIVAEDGTLIFSHGDLDPYLRIPQGDNPKFDLISTVRPNIATRTRGALYKCRNTKAPVSALSSPDGTTPRIKILARPAPSLGDDAVLLSFLSLQEGATASSLERQDSPEHEAVVDQLEKELQATREDLRNTVEELETSNEELRSSNEESMSMNEELQSANEELEATTEELRSLNEELTTVNAQLREKVEQLEHAHDDLNNFFSSTKIATVFFDERLCIKSFTPAAHELLGIDHADTGRFVSDIARDLLQNDLEGEAKCVLEHLTPRSSELHTSDGRWIGRRILPYRTESRRIEGVVVTFTDVTQLRSVNATLETKNQRLELAWEVAKGGIYQHRVPLDESTYHSEQWAQVLGYTRAELPPYERFTPFLLEQVHPDDRTRFDQSNREFIENSAEQLRVELRIRHRDGNYIWVRSISKALQRDERGHVTHILGMMIDITDLKQVEEALRYSEAQFREMTNGLPLVVWVLGAGGDTEFVNDTFCEFFGVTRAQVMEAHGQLPLHPDDAEAYQRKLLGSLQDGVSFHAEARVLHASGEWRWIESWARPRRGPEGAIRGLVGTSADITERRLMESSVRESEMRFRVAKDAAALGIYDYSVASGAVRLDERAQELWGITASGAVTLDTVIAAIHPEDRQSMREAVARALEPAGDPHISITYRVINQLTKETHWIAASGQVAAEGGAPVRIIGTVEDITGRRKAEEAQSRLAAIVRYSDDAIISKTLEGIVTSWNRGAEKLYGYAAEEMVGESISRIMPSDKLDEMRTILERIRRGKAVERYETVRCCKDGSRRDISLTVSAMWDDSGRIIGASAISRDVSERKRFERTLRDNDRRKDDHLAVLSHELRNPLAAIRTASELLGQERDNPESVVWATEVITRQSSIMTALLGGLLDLSHLNQGTLSLDRTDVPIGAVLRDVIEDREPEAKVAGISLFTEIGRKRSLPVLQGDPARLRQAIDSLLGNAIKFTPRGGTITVRAGVEAGEIVIRVKDNGVGFSEDMAEQLFEPFQQGPQDLGRRGGGLGLGLTLARSFLTMHHGTIEARSDGQGKGAEFVVRLPLANEGELAAQAQSAAAGEKAEGGGPLRILLIEDNRDSMDMLHRILQLAGHEVSVTSDGQQGIAVATEQLPDVILCDLGLPGGTSGYDVAKALRSQRRTKHIRLIAVSGYGRSSDKRRSMSAGFDAHLTKPAAIDTINAALAAVVKKGSAR